MKIGYYRSFPERCTPRGKAALEQFNGSILYADGRYVARLPRKVSHLTLPIVKHKGVGTFKHLRNDPVLLKHYGEVMQEQ